MFYILFNINILKILLRELIYKKNKSYVLPTDKLIGLIISFKTSYQYLILPQLINMYFLIKNNISFCQTITKKYMK